ncbi:glycosyltransferase [Granulicella paludicola]|uniref:glycosyltransferase n=1 Tax=Granulicella paludicola TaxID=474951 RepID=UPI0021E09242|nr:glycosyltransferase [Granulicella paludicola]
MKIAIVHPWFLAHGGAEHVVNVLAEMYPEADIFTLLYTERDLSPSLRGRNIIASRANFLPWKYQTYRFLMPLYPAGFEAIDLRGYDLVITSDSCVAKGVLIDQTARQICYCHSPMRALWDLRFEFRDTLPAPFRPIFTTITRSLRQWDFLAAQRVDYFVANSNFVAERIMRYYRRESHVIYPPVSERNHMASASRGDFYLSVGRLTQTKRVDLLIEACNRLKRPLIVVGGGRNLTRLKKIAGSTIKFPGRISDEELENTYRSCRALLFAANEDFGIVPVEAQSYGRPVVSYGHGGSLETVIGIDRVAEGRAPTGVFFREQTVESICEAILQFESMEDSFDPLAIQEHAARFSRSRFEEDFSRLVDEVTAGLTAR